MQFKIFCIANKIDPNPRSCKELKAFLSRVRRQESRIGFGDKNLDHFTPRALISGAAGRVSAARGRKKRAKTQIGN